jgi:histidinol dehydrogenase
MIEIIKDYSSFLLKLKERSSVVEDKYSKVVKEICADISKNGDTSLFNYTKTFDNWDINNTNIKFDKKDLKNAYDSLDDNLKNILQLAKERICDYQKKELQKSWIDIKENGEILGTKIEPIEIAGLYVPGGKAAYPSSVLMNALPAKVAKVEKTYAASLICLSYIIN